MALEPITRQEKIIAGQDLTPITRMEKFLKQYGGGSGGGLAELPDGVPYVETIYDEWGTVTVVAYAESSSCEVTFYDNEGSIRVIEAGKKYRAIFDGKEYICTGADKSLYTWFSADGSNVVSETCPFYFKTAESAANHRKLSVYEAGQHTFSVAEIVEEVHPVDMRCLPEGYPYKEETVNRIPIIEETELTGGTNNGKLVKFETVPTLKGLEAGKLYEFSINGKKQTMECTTAFIPDKYVNQIQVAGVFSAIEVTSGSVDIRIYTDDTTLTSVQFSLYEVEEKTTIHTMAPEFLPALTSPNGTKYQLTVADDGTLSAVAAT